MKTNRYFVGSLVLSLCGLVTYSATGNSGDGSVAYPEGYRSWTHVKSMVIQEGHPLEDPFRGIHHVYANAAAVEGLRTGNYADGAALAFDLFAVAQGDKTLNEGERRLLGVMEKNAGSYSKTGGWGFEAFAGSSRSERLVGDGGVSCFSCHESASGNGYVFSRLRD